MHRLALRGDSGIDETFERIRVALGGRYTLLRELGRGGMATVYLAHDGKHDRQVALKVLRPELAAAIGPERFVREIHVAAQLTHPHVLPLHDSGEADGLLYYVMPYVEGTTLGEHLLQHGPLRLEEVVRLGRQIAQGLHHAHRNGVVHRDVKPGNVLLSEGQAVVADFGLAASSSPADVGLTQPGVAMGTPLYMSPEQASGAGQVDARSDVYGLGCVLFEMVTGRPPFMGDSAHAVMAGHAAEAAPSLRSLRPDAPSALDQLVQRALAKDPAGRFADAGALDAALAEVAHDLETVVERTAGKRSTRKVLLMTGAVVALFAASLGWMIHASRQRAWITETALPGIEAAVGDRDYEAAFQLAQRLEAIDPDNARLATLWGTFSEEVELLTDPPGATILRRPLDAADAEWIHVGTSPITVRLPHAFQRLRFELPGHLTAEIAGHWYYLRGQTTRLSKEGEVPDGMVFVSGGQVALNVPGFDHIPPVGLGSCLMSRHEVTNAEYAGFVEAGGYDDPRFWTEPLARGGQTLDLSQARAYFVDSTGQTGPATWIAGYHPEGQGDHPVTGLSWFEAAAYCAWAERELPSAYHWNRAAETRLSAMVVPESNFDGEGTAPVGRYAGMSAFGMLDMAGNAREWCTNPTSVGERAILGGGWNDLPYMFNDFFAQDPWDRSVTNGLRTMIALESSDEIVTGPLDPPFRDFRAEQPVSDEVFEVYRNLYRYDPLPLNAEVLLTDDSSDDYVTEKVAYDLPYSGERGAAWLYVPRRGTPPFPTIVYFPGSNAIHQDSSDHLVRARFDWLMKRGYAFILPIYKGTYERGTELDSDYPEETQLYFDHVVAWGKELSRAIDYMESREDLDTGRLAYFGASWGGAMGPVMVAIEPRIRAAVLYVAGFCFQRSRPEVDVLHYVPRVTVPVLMLNGRYDHFFPVESSQKPFFEMLGTPDEHKKYFLADGGHFVPQEDLIRETLDWLARYLVSGVP